MTKETLNKINQNVWVISDMHLGHKSILDFEPSRKLQMQKDGFDNHEDWIIHNWNSKIKEHDVVLCLGDFAFKKVQEYTDSLKGDKILILGNHDDFPYREKYKDWEVVDGIYYSGEFTHKILGSNKYEYNDDMLSAVVKDININGIEYRFLFSHYPVFDNDQYDRKNPNIVPRMNRLEEVFNEYNCDFNVHGHTHSIQPDFNKCINASLEQIKFKPIELAELYSTQELY